MLKKLHITDQLDKIEWMAFHIINFIGSEKWLQYFWKKMVSDFFFLIFFSWKFSHRRLTFDYKKRQSTLHWNKNFNSKRINSITNLLKNFGEKKKSFKRFKLVDFSKFFFSQQIVKQMNIQNKINDYSLNVQRNAEHQLLKKMLKEL